MPPAWCRGCSLVHCKSAEQQNSAAADAPLHSQVYALLDVVCEGTDVVQVELKVSPPAAPMMHCFLRHPSSKDTHPL